MLGAYIDVRQQSRKSRELGISILLNGRINLNQKLIRKLDSDKVSFKISRDGLEVLVFKHGSVVGVEHVGYTAKPQVSTRVEKGSRPLSSAFAMLVSRYVFWATHDTL